MALFGQTPERESELKAILERLDGFVYQLFRLSQDEISVIESYLGENPDSQEAVE